MKCKTHPTYKAKKEPKSVCPTCWILWLNARMECISNFITEQIRKENDSDWWP